MGGGSTLGSVGQHSIETTEINRGGEWAGVLLPGPVPLGTRTRPLPAHLPHPPTPLAGLPNAAALTQSTRPADWLEEKNYNVGVGMGGGTEPCSQPGLEPPSVLVLVLLVFFNLIILRGCKSFLSGIQNANDARNDRAVFTLVFLADELDVTQFAEVEVSLLFQPVHCQLQVQELLVEFKNLGISLMATISG